MALDTKIMNRINHLFQHKQENILSMFFTAGYPELETTLPIIEALATSGVDLIEIGMPYSDPIADGPTIQDSSMKALENGMSIDKLFEQLEGVRERVNIPLILMGYLNPVLQYGLEKFVQKAAETGIDGFILPDLPMHEYETEYKELFDAYNISNIFLITPQTSEERIRKIDQNTDGFIYMVSMDSTTGRTGAFSEKQLTYFDQINGMGLKNPRLIGFGISNHDTFSAACQYAQGAIIGSAFIKALKGEGDLETKIADFVGSLKGFART